MDKYLEEQHESRLVPYNDKDYALKQIRQLSGDLKSLASYLSNKIVYFTYELECVQCGLTIGHEWELENYDKSTYPLRKPPGVYVFKCVHCGETIYLPADKKTDWEPYIKGDPV